MERTAARPASGEGARIPAREAQQGEEVARLPSFYCCCHCQRMMRRCALRALPADRFFGRHRFKPTRPDQSFCNQQLMERETVWYKTRRSQVQIRSFAGLRAHIRSDAGEVAS